ncbi:2,5-dichloro-2,5-cyclohexadiene-1,4-diol dehydrogenase 1 [Rhodococcus erythropolis]|nr:2,5-dichloro-2,5-cyclohexadiene-1,4-diol dehydrogenase 1 [Rhodococcus erythropolis]
MTVADIDINRGKETVKLILSDGGEADFIETDVTDEQVVQNMIDWTVARFGGLHGAFNNAGVPSRGIPIKDVAIEDWSKSIAINLTSVFLCMKHEIRYMLENGGGSIVNMSSIMGKAAVANIADYAASKSGIVGMTRVAAIENGKLGIRVNAVMPGAIQTPALAPALEDPAMRAAMEGGHPIGHYGQPEDVAEVVAFLMSDAAAFVTGSAYEVDGAYSAM